MAPSRPTTPSVRRLEAAAGVLVVMLGAWALPAVRHGRGHAGPLLWLLVGSVAAYGVGRALAWRDGFLDRLLAVGIAGSIAVTWPGVLHAGGGPLRYANANATLASLGAIAAIGAATHAERATDRRGWVGLAGALVVANIVTRSVAGTASLLVAVVLVGLGRVSRWSLVPVLGGLVALTVALGATFAVAVGGDPLGFGERAGLRAELWTAAADLVHDAPVRGIGAGEFAAHNPVSDDEDLGFAHHEYLQVAAELGTVGLVLVLALVVVLLLLVRPVGPYRGSPVLATAAVLVVALHATVDHIWHTPVVVVIAALLCGSAVGASAPARHRRVGPLTHG